MFNIKVNLKSSSVHGIGLFSEEDVKKGTVIYTTIDSLDVSLTKEEYESLPSEEQKFIAHYGMFDKRLNRWRLEHDHIRFCNHSTNPNIETKADGDVFALRDIVKGEELLEDYSVFEELREELQEN